MVCLTSQTHPKWRVAAETPLLPHAQGECCRDSAVNKTLNSFKLHDADVFSTANDSTDVRPIVVEQVSPRVRMRSERPLGSVPTNNHLSYTGHHTLHPAFPTFPFVSLVGLSTIPRPSSSPKASRLHC